MAVTMKVVRKKHKTVKPNLDGPKRVKVGFPSGKTDQDVINRAVWNEFGTSQTPHFFKGRDGEVHKSGPIPERPFMRNAMRDHKDDYKTAMEAEAKAILSGKRSLNRTLNKLGLYATGHIQGEIEALKDPPNAPLTVELKGSSNPLIDTGEMRQKVTHQLED